MASHKALFATKCFFFFFEGHAEHFIYMIRSYLSILRNHMYPCSLCQPHVRSWTSSNTPFFHTPRSLNKLQHCLLLIHLSRLWSSCCTSQVANLTFYPVELNNCCFSNFDFKSKSYTTSHSFYQEETSFRFTLVCAICSVYLF